MHRFLFFLALLTTISILGGCNGTQDYSGASVGGDIIDSFNPDPNFDPTDECAPRAIGQLVDSGIARNIGYVCGGFVGYTGHVGLQKERDATEFVCPLYSRTVTFMLGGKTRHFDLGTGYLRNASSLNYNSDTRVYDCQYEGDKYVVGQYDADGPYIFSIGDLFDGPAREDVTTSGKPHEVQGQNISALLQGLDYSPGDGYLDVNDEAHRIIYDEVMTLPTNFLDVDFATFVSNTGDAQAYLDQIANTQGPGAVGSLPVNESEAEASLTAGNQSTVAGLYRFDLATSEYGSYYFTDKGDGTLDLYAQEAIVSDGLQRDMAAMTSSTSAICQDPGDVSTCDPVLLANLNEFLPFTVVDRNGNVFGGGPFSQVRFGNTANDAVQQLCSDHSVFMGMSGSASLGKDLVFNQFTFTPVGATGSMTVPGRFMQGKAYSGVAVPDVATDYDIDYPSPAHEFDASSDHSAINTSSLCGNANVDDQLILGYGIKGRVAPVLDPDIMSTLFSSPGQYTISYSSRDLADDAEPDVKQVATMKITIHQNGAIFTDLDGDGNPGIDVNNPAASNEYVVGMVSSVYPGADDPGTPTVDESLTKATANLLIFNLGPADKSAVIPKYGSHFRARLVPDNSCVGDNRLFAASDAAVADGSKAYWYDPKAILDWFRSVSSPSQAQQYQAARTLSYGYVTAVRTDCP